MKKDSPTMKDVARLAGVSQPTVSYVINGSASISQEVKNRVHDAIRAAVSPFLQLFYTAFTAP